jgi:hypothetical protein
MYHISNATSQAREAEELKLKLKIERFIFLSDYLKRPGKCITIKRTYTF